MYLVVEATELPDGLVLELFLEGDLSCIPLWYQERVPSKQPSKESVWKLCENLEKATERVS